jgi:hypothetical protein
MTTQTHTAPTATDLIDEWVRVAPSVFQGRNGWQVRKLRTVSGFSWITHRPDGTEVLDRHGRRYGYRSAMSAQLAAAALIIADIQTS